MKIFLAHAKEDEKVTEDIYNILAEKGYSPWMDIRDIPAGVNWDFEIQKNFSNSNIIIIILSKVSTQKNGYIRREINEAIDKLKYYKPDDIFVIPLLIDDAQVPSYISSKIQFIDFKRSNCWDILDKSLKLAANQQNMEISEGVSFGPFTIITEKINEIYEKVPGHEIEIFFPKVTSPTLPSSSKVITGYFNGLSNHNLLSQRTSPWPFETSWNKEYRSTYISSYNEGFNVAFCNKNILSILHVVNWYGAGAAHPNMHFRTSNFVITDEDYAYKFSLSDIFQDDNYREATQEIKKKILSESFREYWEKTGEKPNTQDIETFTKGIDDSLLSNYTLTPEGMTFHFAPYEIHCYALGPWQIFVSFYDVLDYLRKDGIYHLMKNS